MQIGIIFNLKKYHAFDRLKDFFDRVKNLDLKFVIQESVAKDIPFIPQYINIVSDKNVFSKSNLIIAFGGDGTILKTVQLVGDHEIPILGVNIGSLGFLAATSTNNVIKHIKQFSNNKLEIEKRSLLELKIKNVAKKWFAFNDFVIDKAGFHRVIKIVTKIDGQLLNSYISDGLIISTPTGSTAYSMANGGPIVFPSSNVFVLNPICPHTLSNRPVVIPDQAIIELRVHSEIKKYQLICDGQALGIFDENKSIKIYKAQFKVSLVKVPENNFYNTLRSKLGWGEDFRNKKRWD